MPSAPDHGESRDDMPVAVSIRTLILLALATSMLVVFLLGAFAHPAGDALAGVQPTPTWTSQPVLTVAPETGGTPAAATVTRTTGGIHNPSPTALPTAPAITPPTVPPTPDPTAPVGGG